MTRVLLIEDNEDNIALLSFLLESDGFEVCVAQSGEAGVEQASTTAPDIILLDVNLPDMSGLEVLARIRENSEHDTIPVVAVTSMAMAGDRERMLQSGCNGYIEKPIDALTFASQVREIVDANSNNTNN